MRYWLIALAVLAFIGWWFIPPPEGGKCLSGYLDGKCIKISFTN
jgi:hypothetical protein